MKLRKRPQHPGFGPLILFLTHVTCLELWRWDADAAKPTLVVTTRLGVSSGNVRAKQMCGLWCHQSDWTCKGGSLKWSF